MSFDISRTDLESFINFEDRLNNFWSHKVYRVLLEKKRLAKMNEFLVLKGNLFIWL